MAVRLLILRAGRPLPQEDSWCSFLLEAESILGHSAAGQLQNPVTSGILTLKCCENTSNKQRVGSWE
jgi:hypothetical protein